MKYILLLLLGFLLACSSNEDQEKAAPQAEDKLYTEAQATVPLPTMSLRMIPGVGSKAAPSIAQLIGANWQFSGDIYGTRNAALNVRDSAEDPLGLLPVHQIIGGISLYGNMTLSAVDMKILKDYLK